MSQGHAAVDTGEPDGPRLEPGARQIDVIIEVATWFYVHGWSQVRIARALDLDPSTVSRYLKRARDESIVRVDIRRPADAALDLSRELADRIGVPRAIVVRTGGLEAVASAAAEHVDGLLVSGTGIGISWGKTLTAVVRHLRPGSVSRLTISQLAGGLDDSTPGIQGHELVRSLGVLFPGSRQRYLLAPAIVDSPQTRDAIVRERSVAAALSAAASSSIALVGIGDMGDESTLASGGHVGPADLAHLRSAGAVGNMNTRFFNAEGRSVGDLDARTIAVTWEELRTIPTVIAVATGRTKATAIAGASRVGCIDVLVTDEDAARELLETG